MKTAVKVTLQVIGGAVVLSSPLIIGWGMGMMYFGNNLRKYYPTHARLILNLVRKDADDTPVDDASKYLVLHFIETALS